MDKICGIYKITSPSDKIYIGQSYDIDRRFSQYRRLESCVKNQKKLFNSFLKYGVENHKFEIIETCLFENLNKRERYWQEKLNVVNENGLNISLVSTDNAKQIHSAETKKIISNKLKGNKNTLGKKHSEETKEKIRQKAIGRNLSKETKNKLSTIKKGNFRITKKCVKVFCVKTNKEWYSIAKCWRELYSNIYSYGYFKDMLRNKRYNKTSIKKK